MFTVFAESFEIAAAKNSFAAKKAKDFGL